MLKQHPQIKAVIEQLRPARNALQERFEVTSLQPDRLVFRIFAHKDKVAKLRRILHLNHEVTCLVYKDTKQDLREKAQPVRRLSIEDIIAKVASIQAGTEEPEEEEDLSNHISVIFRITPREKPVKVRRTEVEHNMYFQPNPEYKNHNFPEVPFYDNIVWRK